MNNKRKIGESYRPKAIDSFGYQSAEQVSMPSKPPTSGSNIIKTEKLSQNEGVREVIKQLCERFGRIKENEHIPESKILKQFIEYAESKGFKEEQE